jgi:hypothetical protein
LPPWIRIRNLKADPDPATQINADPDTDPDPKPCLLGKVCDQGFNWTVCFCSDRSCPCNFFVQKLFVQEEQLLVMLDNEGQEMLDRDVVVVSALVNSNSSSQPGPSNLKTEVVFHSVVEP